MGETVGMFAGTCLEIFRWDCPVKPLTQEDADRLGRQIDALQDRGRLGNNAAVDSVHLSANRAKTKSFRLPSA